MLNLKTIMSKGNTVIHYTSTARNGKITRQSRSLLDNPVCVPPVANLDLVVKRGATKGWHDAVGFEKAVEDGDGDF